ncbi:hypothetical protein PV08_02083 [Exophiala spinifera]|uniref:SnoaL-like domain-containing protein n=1 Tax=Exophiala spinifera TaxID=91928 RepID=A0A0D2BR78_9EURO|nr:uncharacterized protein PV08_02083 [Exophiala spinifera]KIW21503.1 hypothetical protein PV08_02083 [Exophiala spinifera]
MDLRTFYLGYIAAINTSTDLATDLCPYVKEGLIHSHDDKTPLSVDAFAEMLRQSQRDLPGLHFGIDMLVVENDLAKKDAGNIASRLRLSYQPSPGTTQVFFEHCMYRVEEGKIARVWTVLDGAGQKWLEEHYGHKN